MADRWILAPPEELASGPDLWKNSLAGIPFLAAGSESIPSCIARLLMRRGFTTVTDIENFLRPRLNSLSDPFLLPHMDLAVARIFRALDSRERVVLFGDYDVDGVTSLALLAEVLKSYGLEPNLFLPLRMEEGYGLSAESVERCFQQFHPELLITVDCGTSCAEEIFDLGRRGVDVIVLDHHQPKSPLPDCVAIVNPKTDAGSPFHYLCSVGIVFKLCHALLKRRWIEFDLKSQLDLVALGTVADIVPLCGENRTLVQRGAMQIARSHRLGLRKLIEVSGVRPPILTEDIGFRLGPRLNAAGRLSTAEKSLRLLLTQDDAEARQLADFLDKQNRDRQHVEKEIFLAAEMKIAGTFDPARDAAIVVAGRGWHPGVLGIVASRIARKYHRPAIVIGIDENGIGKGSGRSIEGLNLIEALAKCGDKIEKFGGHEMAAGLTIREKDVLLFSETFRCAARALLSDHHLARCLRLDHEIAFPELNFDFLQWHELLQPFGSGNPQPLFFAREVEPVAPPRIVGEKHLVLRLRQHNYHQRAVFFDSARLQLPRPPWDIAFRIRSGEYEGEARLDIHVEALRKAEGVRS